MTALALDVRELNFEEIEAVSGASDRSDAYYAGAAIASAGVLAGGTGVGIAVALVGLAIMGSSFFIKT